MHAVMKKVVLSKWKSSNECRSEQVKVANCAGANAAAVAELAVGLMLACDRRIVAQDCLSKQSAWAKGTFGDGRSKGLKGRVLGIIGFGRIGRYGYQDLFLILHKHPLLAFLRERTCQTLLSPS